MLAFALASKKSSLPAPSGPKSVEQVLRELAVLGFSDIGKVVRWRPELVYEELEDADNLDQPVRQVLQSRVLVIDSATLPPEARLAVAEVSQTANGLRVKMHDKHGRWSRSASTSACSSTRSKSVRGTPLATSRCRPRSGKSSTSRKADERSRALGMACDRLVCGGFWRGFAESLRFRSGALACPGGTHGRASSGGDDCGCPDPCRRAGCGDDDCGSPAPCRSAG
jgi:hypothetical protein